MAPELVSSLGQPEWLPSGILRVENHNPWVLLLYQIGNLWSYPNGFTDGKTCGSERDILFVLPRHLLSTYFCPGPVPGMGTLGRGVINAPIAVTVSGTVKTNGPRLCSLKQHTVLWIL